MPNPKKPEANRPLPDVEIFYDARDKGYWFKPADRFLNLSSSDLKMHLKTKGFQENDYRNEFKGLDSMQHVMIKAQIENVVDYAGPLAGHKSGLYKTTGGTFILVTRDNPVLYEDYPKKLKLAQPRWFISFLQELLPGEQWFYLAHWLRLALESLRNGDFRQGQVCVFAGESGCGKSLLQNIITEILGGRCADPFPYMMGEKFNYALAGAEHWQIEDPASTTDPRTRRFFGARLKECNYNRDFSINQKGKDALLLQLFRRTTISVNLEPENLAVIPPLDDSIKDKIFMFKCDVVKNAFKEYLDEQGSVDRLRLWNWVTSNIREIRCWLLHGLPRLAPGLQRGREGISAWQHPELMSELQNLSQELRLLTLIDEVVFHDAETNADTFTGKAIEIEKLLRTSNFQFEAEKILKYPGAAGAYLGRLAKDLPDRISKSVKDGYTTWTIKPPVKQQTTE